MQRMKQCICRNRSNFSRVIVKQCRIVDKGVNVNLGTIVIMTGAALMQSHVRCVATGNNGSALIVLGMEQLLTATTPIVRMTKRLK